MISIRSVDDPTTEHRERISLKDAAPEVYRAMAAFDCSIELDSSLHELVKIRASQLNGCAYCIAMHTRDARKAGESEQRLYALAAWRESPLFTVRERAALELTDAITKIGENGVPEALYERAEAEFSSAELANLILAITAINAWNRIAVSSGIVFTETLQ
jgi:AhpD family alkylhydroperoxidase